MYVDLIILYKQFNFGLVPQTFGLVTLSNSLPEGQPHFSFSSRPVAIIIISALMNENSQDFAVP